MTTPDPLRDIERQIAALASRMDLSDARTAAAFDAIRVDVVRAREELERMRAEAEEHVPLVRYMPLERVVYGAIGIILIAVVTALVGMVVRS